MKQRQTQLKHIACRSCKVFIFSRVIDCKVERRRSERECAVCDGRVLLQSMGIP